MTNDKLADEIESTIARVTRLREMVSEHGVVTLTAREYDTIIAALRAERPQSGEMVKELREVLEWTRALLRNIAKASPEVLKHTDIESFILNEINPALAITARLAAAEAERRKT